MNQSDLKNDIAFGKGVIMSRRIITIMICLTVVRLAAAKNPTALELLDKYAQTQDKIYKSFVIKFEEAREQYNSHTYGLEKGKRRGGTLCEMRFDGARFYACRKEWGNCMAEARTFIPRDDPKCSTMLWDGRFHYSFGKLPDQKLRELAEERFKTTNEREKFLQERSGMLTITDRPARPKGSTPSDFLGAIKGHCDDFHDPQLISILRQASKVSLRDEMQQIGPSKCYVIDAVTKRGTYAVWIDPDHSYNIAQFDNKWETSQTDPRGKIQRHISMKNIQFKKSADIWIPSGAETTDVTRNFDDGMLRITKRRYKRTDVLLNPDHDGLGSFAPDFPNGCRVQVKGLESIDESKKYTWQSGQVVDDKGRIVLDLSSEKPVSAKPESKAR